MMTRTVLRYISMIYTDKFRYIGSYPERAAVGLAYFRLKVWSLNLVQNHQMMVSAPDLMTIHLIL